MANNIDPRYLDKRTAERYIRMGLLDEKAWERHLSSLEDVTEKGAIIETVVGDEDEFEDEEIGDEEQA